MTTRLSGIVFLRQERRHSASRLPFSLREFVCPCWQSLIPRARGYMHPLARGIKDCQQRQTNSRNENGNREAECLRSWRRKTIPESRVVIDETTDLGRQAIGLEP